VGSKKTVNGWGGIKGTGCLLLAFLLLGTAGESVAGDPESVGQGMSGQETDSFVQQALERQTRRVDQQIEEFETHYIAVQQDLPPQGSIAGEGQGEGSSILMMKEGEQSGDEGEVQVLEETVVTDTYLDPFDESGIDETVDDPWEPMNTRMFSFNLQADRYVLKPLATGYAWVMPDLVERAIGRAIHNIRFVPRTMNNLFQQKWKGASVETGRFLVNTTVGVAGLFDVAESQFGLAPANPEDFGQTLAMYGVRSGPYLVLPFLPPTTVRDGAGLVGDTFMDPLSYFLPFVPQATLKTTEIVNERSQNLELFEGVEAGTIDLYGAVRSGYMQKRLQMIKE